MDDNLLPQQTSIDTCHYTINLPSTSSSTSSLVALLPTLLTFIATSSNNYIWHKQSFNLSLSPIPFSSSSSSTNKVQYLEGKTDCTDCVDDEWFIVYLLREMTRIFQDLVISVEDEDGQFLLIEGAEVLPKWVTPINAENRVWIYQGRLHLIPIEHRSAVPFEGIENISNPSFDPEEDGFIDRSVAIDLVRDPSINTLAPTQLEDIVFSRINIYPAKIQEHLHRTLTYLPTDIALAVSDSPALISEAIAAFYEREPASLRACNTMTRFPPSSTTDAYTTASIESSKDLPSTIFGLITLTRPLYSQLVLQRFFPPKPFEKVNWMEGSKLLGDEEERRRMVGMKIACGFEMLYKTTSPQLRSESTSFNTLDPKYKAFITRLESSNYFEGELVGSKKYVEKELFARKGWESSLIDDSKTKSFAQRVDESILRSKNLLPPLSPPSILTTRLTSSEALALEDSESWLSLDESNFEAMLHSRGPGMEGLDDLDDDDGEDDSSDEDDDDGDEKMEGVEESEEGGEKKNRNKKEEDRKAKKIAREMKGMADKVEEFVQGRGAVDGAEFSDEQSSDEEEEDEDLPELSPEEKLARSNKLVAPLDDLEWGHKESTSTSTDTPPPLSTSTSLPLPPRAPKLTTNKYDGASSDDDSSDEGEPMNEGEEGLGGEEIEGENGPSVVGGEDDEEDLDMQEEMDEFLKFATETLGLSKEQYEKILGERAGRGAFVPGPAPTKKKNIIPTKSAPTTTSTTAAPKATPEPIIPKVEPVKVPLRNPNLTDFDALMEQMDVELQKSRAASSSKPSSSTSTSNKSKPTNVKSNPTKSKSANPKAPFSTRTDKITMDSDPSSDEADNSEDEEMESMDAELAELFKSAGDVRGDGTGEDGNGTMDYNLVKNFLESFQSQGGFGGPAGNLSGRLGFKMPKNFEES